jgi:hypothetical protein
MFTPVQIEPVGLYWVTVCPNDAVTKTVIRTAVKKVDQIFIKLENGFGFIFFLLIAGWNFLFYLWKDGNRYPRCI